MKSCQIVLLSTSLLLALAVDVADASKSPVTTTDKAVLRGHRRRLEDMNYQYNYYDGAQENQYNDYADGDAADENADAVEEEQAAEDGQENYDNGQDADAAAEEDGQDAEEAVDNGDAQEYNDDNQDAADAQAEDAQAGDDGYYNYDDDNNINNNAEGQNQNDNNNGNDNNDGNNNANGNGNNGGYHYDYEDGWVQDEDGNANSNANNGDPWYTQINIRDVKIKRPEDKIMIALITISSVLCLWLLCCVGCLFGGCCNPCGTEEYEEEKEEPLVYVNGDEPQNLRGVLG
jgi:hypothetical protein